MRNRLRFRFQTRCQVRNVDEIKERVSVDLKPLCKVGHCQFFQLYKSVYLLHNSHVGDAGSIALISKQ